MTMTNAEWMIKNGYEFSSLHALPATKCKREYNILLNNKCIEKVKDSYPAKAITTWLDMEHKEHKEPILDDAERRYLSAVIRPFRKHVQNIAKYLTFGNTEEYIIIHIDSSERVYFPHFKADTMYKGMELNREYTLEELGL